MVKILICQLNPILGDFEGNLKKITESLKHRESYDVAVFPELSLSGYMPLDLIFDPSFITRQNHALSQLLQFAKDKLVIIGGIDSSHGEKPFYNSLFLLHEGEIKAKYHKMCLPTYDVFDEKRYFSEGQKPLVFQHMNQKFALSICEDIWAAANEVKETNYANHPFHAYQDVDVIINISASPFVKGKIHQRIELLAKLAKNYNSKIVYCCQTGGQDGIVFDGGSLVFNQLGEVCTFMKVFDEDTQVVDLQNLLPQEYQILNPYDEIEKAIIMGIKDFFYKQGFKSCLVGLSGGIDSSLTLYLAVKALGASHVQAFMIPSLFTSDMSIEDAGKIAELMNVKILSAPLGKVLTELEEMVKAQTSYQLKDITHQNMQSRLRGLFLMAMSNQTDALVITTGNKSEVAVGYSTLYGDTCGAFAPIADLFKMEVYGLAKHIQKKEHVFPERVFIKAPSAELARDQKDEDNLPPYVLLDEILKLILEENYSLEKILETKKFPEDIVRWVVKKVFQMEYKRQQYCPVVKLSKKTFNTGRKVPIVQKFY